MPLIWAERAFRWVPTTVTLFQLTYRHSVAILQLPDNAGYLLLYVSKLPNGQVTAPVLHVPQTGNTMSVGSRILRRPGFARWKDLLSASRRKTSILKLDAMTTGSRGYAPRRITIVGAGISGPAAAWGLNQHPDRFDFRLFEAQDRIGGNAVTVDMPQEHGSSIPFEISVTACISSLYEHIVLLMKQFGIG